MTPETPSSSSASVATSVESLHAPVERQPNLPLALAAGAGASLVGAIVWAVITVSLEMQIGFMAVGVGFLVGYAVGFFNPQHDKTYGYIGAALALAGCLLGNVLAILGAVSVAKHISFFQILSVVDFSLIPSVMAENFSPIDLLFYGIAVYEGYKFSVRGPKRA